MLYFLIKIPSCIVLIGIGMTTREPMCAKLIGEMCVFGCMLDSVRKGITFLCLHFWYCSPLRNMPPTTYIGPYKGKFLSHFRSLFLQVLSFQFRFVSYEMYLMMLKGHFDDNILHFQSYFYVISLHVSPFGKKKKKKGKYTHFD